MRVKYAGAYESHNNFSTRESASAYSIRPKHADLKGSTSVPGPKYDVRRDMGDPRNQNASPTYSFSLDERRGFGKIADGPGPGAYEATVEIGTSFTGPRSPGR